ncbi:MAG TPA: hypothetical protein VJ962_10130 [Clostridia bacterium]|nr:hypothetical protein [Clostridia bacterium]
MIKVITVKNTLEGIGLDFYSAKDSKSFNDLIKTLESQNIKIDETKINWDIDNNRISYPNAQVNKIFKNIQINLSN